MNQNSVIRVFLSIVVAVVTLMSGVIWLDQQQAQAQNVACYREQGGAKWVAGVIGSDACEWEMQDGTVLDVQSGNTATFAGELIYGPQAETVAAGWSVTPTSPYVVMTSSAEVTSSTSTGIVTTTATAGQVVILRNGNASDVINVDGTGGTIECKADVAMGAGDTLTLIFNGTDWNCISSYDNS